MLKNIYCDESCHLPNDGIDVMLLGAIECPYEKKNKIFQDIRKIKEKHGLNSWFEIKWTKVSKGKIDFYLELLDYFFENDDLSYRCILTNQKNELDHETYNNGDYNDWYYKMYYFLLRPMLVPPMRYRIFIDIKDTCGGPKVRTLERILKLGIKNNNQYGILTDDILRDIKQINSRESEVLQLADLINGAVAFYNRGLYHQKTSSDGKRFVIEHLIKQHKIRLSNTTAVTESKFNIFIWQPRGSIFR